MIPQNASVDLIQHEIEQINKRIDAWSRRAYDLREEAEKFDRWIRMEQGDLEIAEEMLKERGSPDEASTEAGD